MQDQAPMIAAMAEKCRSMIQASGITGGDLPKALRPPHLVWMCDRIEKHADDWPATRLHRWIGFVQSAMLANRIVDLAGAKAMFDALKNAYRQTSDDPDLTDHIDPDSSFEFEVGGQG
jgi:hypothetical protein